MREWWSKIRAMLAGRRALPDELSEEVEAHLEMEIRENLSRGMPLEEARQRAQRDFGNRTAVAERARDAWMFERLESFVKDVAYAGRMMRKNPGFAVTAILTLALGIGANTAIFTVIRAVLLKPLEYREPDRLVRISVDNAQQGYRDVGFTLARYQEMKATPRSFSELGAFFIASEHMTLSGGAEPEQITVARVSANFLHVLGVQPLLGRGFLPEEDRTGGRHVVLISAELWRRRFGADPLITGKTITLNATPYHGCPITSRIG